MKQHVAKSRWPVWNSSCTAAKGELFMTEEQTQLIVNTALAKRKSKKGHLQYLCDTLSCDKLTAKAIMTDIDAGKGINLEDYTQASVQDMGKYTWNKATDTYVIPMKTYGANFVITGAQHRALCNAYSTWGGKYKSLEEIGIIYNMTPDMIKEYVRVFNLTRKSVPVTKEELLEGEVSDAVKRVYDTKKRAFDQEILHNEWKRIQAESNQWRALKAGELDPFERTLANYTPTPLTKINYTDQRPRNNQIFMIGLSDLHFGGLARSSELYAGQDFNAEKIQQIIDVYATKIANEVRTRRTQFHHVVICSLGDILHSLTGFTVKGVPLEADVLREEQFELALDSLISFISRMIEIFGLVEVYAVKGNHAGAGDYILMRTIKAHFRTDKRIKFNLFKSRQACFRIGATAILIDHGASDTTKSVIPTNGQSKEAYVQSLFLQYPEVLNGATCKVMLQGDRHKFMYEELRGFDHVIMGSCVVGDRYADQLGLHSRARQNCLILDEDGVNSILNFYFD